MFVLGLVFDPNTRISKIIAATVTRIYNQTPHNKYDKWTNCSLLVCKVKDFKARKQPISHAVRFMICSRCEFIFRMSSNVLKKGRTTSHMETNAIASGIRATMLPFIRSWSMKKRSRVVHIKPPKPDTGAPQKSPFNRTFG